MDKLLFQGDEEHPKEDEFPTGTSTDLGDEDNEEEQGETDDEPDE